MKKSILLACSIIVGLMGYSCSSDDNTPVNEEKASLIGEWQVESIDFSIIEEDAHPIYQSDFCVMEYIAGYDFKADGSFIFVATENKFGVNDRFDIWNWEGDANDFTINQPNPADTNGYIFAPKDISNIALIKIDGIWNLTFEATLHLGSKATFRLEKKPINKETHRPELLYKGEYKEPCSLLG